jgi:hypothetical protein
MPLFPLFVGRASAGNQRRLFDRSDDLQPAAAVRAMLEVDAEDAWWTQPTSSQDSELASPVRANTSPHGYRQIFCSSSAGNGEKRSAETNVIS